MGLKRRQFTKEFKLKIVHEIEAGKSQTQIARQLNPNTIARWRQEYRKYKDQAFAGPGKPYTDEARIAELERMVGRLTMENDLLKKVLQRFDNSAQ